MNRGPLALWNAVPSDLSAALAALALLATRVRQAMLEIGIRVWAMRDNG